MTVPYHVNKKPWRKVISSSRPIGGRGSVLGPDTTRRTHWYELTLECGHVEERTVKYKPIGRSRGGTQHRSGQDALPPPKKVRCGYCKDIK